MTDSTALEAHPATPRRLEAFSVIDSLSLSFSLVAVALLFVRFLDRREEGREGVLLPAVAPDPARSRRNEEVRRFDLGREFVLLLLLSSGEESEELPVGGIIGDLRALLEDGWCGREKEDGLLLLRP